MFKIFQWKTKWTIAFYVFLSFGSPQYSLPSHLNRAQLLPERTCSWYVHTLDQDVCSILPEGTTQRELLLRRKWRREGQRSNRAGLHSMRGIALQFQSPLSLFVPLLSILYLNFPVEETQTSTNVRSKSGCESTNSRNIKPNFYEPEHTYTIKAVRTWRCINMRRNISATLEMERNTPSML